MSKNFSFLLSMIVTLSYPGLANDILDGGTILKYFGTKLCGQCHKTEASGKQFVIWENSKHAQAYKTLTTPDADLIAKENGFTTKAVETEGCLKCYGTRYNVDTSLLTDKFYISDGIQCETCH